MNAKIIAYQRIIRIIYRRAISANNQLLDKILDLKNPNKKMELIANLKHIIRS